MAGPGMRCTLGGFSLPCALAACALELGLTGLPESEYEYPGSPPFLGGRAWERGYTQTSVVRFANLVENSVIVIFVITRLLGLQKESSQD